MKFSFLFFFTLVFSVSYSQIPIFRIDSTRQKLLRSNQPNYSKLKTDKSDLNKMMDRSESERTLIQRESTRFSKLLQIENKKDRISEKSNAYLSVVLFVGESRSIDSVYYSITELKVDTTNRRSFSQEIDLNDSEAVKITKTIARCISKYRVLLSLGSPYTVRAFTSMINYERIQLSQADLDEKLSKLSDTTSKISLNNYGLKKFPKQLYKFKNAKLIDLSKNEIYELRLNTKRFKKLETLVLSDNLLSEKKLLIRRNKNLKIINLTNNDFGYFPYKIGRNLKLEELSLAGNFIDNFGDKKLKRFKNLKVLNLYNNNLTMINPSIKYLKSLEVLDIYHNGLRQLPEEITSLANLQTLAVSNNDFWDLPNNLFKLSNLQNLYAHHNKLNLLPDLPKGLKLIDLGYNLFEDVPSQLKYLDELRELDISNNRIRNSGSELLRIKGLEKLFIGNNDFNEDPAKFAELQQIIVDLEKKSVKVK